jgi:hypothetical protein
MRLLSIITLRKSGVGNAALSQESQRDRASDTSHNPTPLKPFSHPKGSTMDLESNLKKPRGKELP